MKPLPKETYLTPGKVLNMHIIISASIKSNDDISISLGHSSKGDFEDVTKHLLYKLSGVEEDKSAATKSSKTWIVDMKLSYPFREDLGHLIISIGDRYSHIGDKSSFFLTM